jgi:hypothetical protein
MTGYQRAARRRGATIRADPEGRDRHGNLRNHAEIPTNNTDLLCKGSTRARGLGNFWISSCRHEAPQSITTQILGSTPDQFGGAIGALPAFTSLAATSSGDITLVTAQ